jgi:hypothetical protein
MGARAGSVGDAPSDSAGAEAGAAPSAPEAPAAEPEAPASAPVPEPLPQDPREAALATLRGKGWSDDQIRRQIGGPIDGCPLEILEDLATKALPANKGRKGTAAK